MYDYFRVGENIRYAKSYSLSEHGFSTLMDDAFTVNPLSCSGMIVKAEPMVSRIKNSRHYSIIGWNLEVYNYNFHQIDRITDANVLNKEKFNYLPDKSEKKYDKDRKAKQMLAHLGIKDVIFSGPATIIKWYNGYEDTKQHKTVVKCSKNDDYDPQKAFLVACFKEISGLTSTQVGELLDYIEHKAMETEKTPWGEIIDALTTDLKRMSGKSKDTDNILDI